MAAAYARRKIRLTRIQMACRLEAHPNPRDVGKSITREQATILELPNQSKEDRATAELTAIIGARVVGSDHLKQDGEEK